MKVPPMRDKAPAVEGSLLNTHITILEKGALIYVESRIIFGCSFNNFAEVSNALINRLRVNQHIINVYCNAVFHSFYYFYECSNKHLHTIFQTEMQS